MPTHPTDSTDETIRFCQESKDELNHLWRICQLYQDLKHQAIAWRDDTRLGLERLFRAGIADEFIELLDDPRKAREKVGLDSYVAHASSYLDALSVRLQRAPFNVLPATGAVGALSNDGGLQTPNRGIPVHDVFLSHSSEDSAVALNLREAIVAAGHRVFLSTHALKPGDDFVEAIRQGLLNSRELWLLVSPNSLASEWVISEWGAAWVLDKRIVPILHNCGHGDLPLRLAGLQCTNVDQVSDAIVQLRSSAE